MPRKPPRDTAPPAIVTDNTGGRPIDPRAAGQAIGFLFGAEILRRLEARKAQKVTA